MTSCTPYHHHRLIMDVMHAISPLSSIVYRLSPIVYRISYRLKDRTAPSFLCLSTTAPPGTTRHSSSQHGSRLRKQGQLELTVGLAQSLTCFRTQGRIRVGFIKTNLALITRFAKFKYFMLFFIKFKRKHETNVVQEHSILCIYVYIPYPILYLIPYPIPYPLFRIPYRPSSDEVFHQEPL